MRCAVIIVAGGSGTRFKSKVPKSFVMLKGKPLIAHSLTVFQSCSTIKGIVIVGHVDFMRRFNVLAKKFNKVVAVAKGGETRAGSVKNGLAALGIEYDHVLVHDAARPLVSREMLTRMIDALKDHPAVITAVPVKATIKQVNDKTMTVQKTLPRSLLWEVQTPQGFKRSLLEKAHQQRFKGEATDDAMLVEHLGVKVKVVAGDYRNIKITTPEDLLLAKALS